MSRRKTERLLNLVICLLSTRRNLTAAQIRQAVPGYPDGDEAFQRMFERDKTELRELGVPLEVGVDPWDDEAGYRISRQAYELPEIALEPDEAAVLGLAAHVWQRASLAEAASGAMLKLSAGGTEHRPSLPPGLELRVDTPEPAFPVVWSAVRDRRPVRFDYRTGGSDTVTTRTLEPWGVVSRRGHWYTGGHDRVRGASRVFRLSRIVGEVKFAGPPDSITIPEDADVRDLVIGASSDGARERIARVHAREDTCEGLRHAARQIRPAGDGWDELDIAFSDPEWFAGFVVGFGADAVVTDPPDAREAVIRRLKGVLA